jgi:hypothetical protein
MCKCVHVHVRHASAAEFKFICGSRGWGGGGVEVEMMANRHAEDAHTCG